MKGANLRISMTNDRFTMKNLLLAYMVDLFSYLKETNWKNRF